MDFTKVYYDSEGCPGNILKVVKREPEWAANQIQAGERAIEQRTQLLEACKLALPELEFDAKHNATDIPLNTALNAVKSAIKKAEGEG